MAGDKHLSGPQVVDMLLEEAHKTWEREHTMNSFANLVRLTKIMEYWNSVYHAILVKGGK